MSKSKAKGTRFESALVAHMVDRGFAVERRALTGTADRGDITGMKNVIIEAKNHTALSFGPWLDEAARERANANAEIGVVVASRRMRPIGASFAVMDLDTLLILLDKAGYRP